MAVFGVVNFELLGVGSVSPVDLDDLLDVSVDVVHDDIAPREYFFDEFLAGLDLNLAVLIGPLYLR